MTQVKSWLTSGTGERFGPGLTISVTRQSLKTPEQNVKVSVFYSNFFRRLKSDFFLMTITNLLFMQYAHSMVTEDLPNIVLFGIIL